MGDKELHLPIVSRSMNLPESQVRAELGIGKDTFRKWRIHAALQGVIVWRVDLMPLGRDFYWSRDGLKKMLALVNMRPTGLDAILDEIEARGPIPETDGVMLAEVRHWMPAARFVIAKVFELDTEVKVITGNTRPNLGEEIFVRKNQTVNDPWLYQQVS